MPAATTIQEKIEFQERRVERFKTELKVAIGPWNVGFWETELKKARKALKRRQTLLKNGTY